MQLSGLGLAAVFWSWCELLRFENIVSPYFELGFHPMKWPLIFQSLWFSQPGFSSGTWTAISSSSWDSCTFYPLWRFLQLCHLGSLGVSHHGTTGEMTKISISSTVMRHCNIQKLWLQTPGSQPAPFTMRMSLLVCSFTEPFSLPTCVQHFVSFSWKANWKSSSPFATQYVGRVFICPKSGLKIQLYQPFCSRYCGQVLFSTERINFLPLDMFRRH